MSPLEIFAAVTGFISGYLAVRNRAANWPIGIISCGIYVLIFARAHLPVSMWLQVLYIVTSILGWVAWARPRADGTVLPIRRMSTLPLVAAFVATVLGSLILGWILVEHSSDRAPYGDAAIGMFALTATAIMARRYLDHWWFWTVANCVGVVVYARLGFYPTAILWSAFQILAIAGIVGWRRELNAQAR